MTKTANPAITVTVSGPTGSGKSRVLAVIADVLKLIHSDCIIEAPDVQAEKEMCGDDHTAWHKPRSGTIFKLEELNQSINPNRLLGVICKEESLTTQPIPGDKDRMVIELVDQQIKGSIDPVTARAIWYNVTKDGDVARLASHLTFALNCAVDRCHHKIMARGLNTHGIPEALPEQELQAENISHIYNSAISQLYGKTDMVRAHKFWQKTLEEMKDDKSLLVEILIQVIADINNQQDMAQ